MEIWRGHVLWRVYVHPHTQLKKSGIPHTHTQSMRGFPVKTGTGSGNTHGDGFICHLYVSCCVLYDSGATHSFVSDSCVKHLGLPVCELQCELAVSTPASRLVTTSSLCARYSVEVEGRMYKVNLICLPLQDLEVILGMDWLSANRILIDCREKTTFLTIFRNCY